MTVRLIVFPGGFNWPVFVAQEKGMFAQHGVEVSVSPTPDSVFQVINLVRGNFDIAMTAFDNVVAYQEGQGAVSLDREPDLFAFMGADSGFLSLMAAPGIETLADLRGQTLSVDAPTTGYAFVLLEILRRAGLAPEDCTIVSAGGMTQRWDALRQGRHAATLLSAPYDILAEAEGFRRLADATEMLGHYQGNVGATRRAWARANEAALVGYVRGYVAALDWLYDTGTRAEALEILRRSVPQISSRLADRVYDVLLHPSRGFHRRAAVDPDGLRAVLALRSRFGRPRRELSDPARYYDPVYYERALR